MLFRLHRRQRGFMILTIALVILMIGATVLLSDAGIQLAKLGSRQTATQDSMSKVSDALVNFAAINHRLPCPANPGASAANPGFPNDNSDLNAAIATCDFPGGVIPWRALGLKQDEVVDEWGRLLSYRVFNGTFGLTQSEGASAINCDTDNELTTETPPGATGLCDSDTHTLTSSFLSHANYTGTPTTGLKGLNVDDFGQSKTGIAFVLISHGPSGSGGYAPGGVQTAIPAIDAGDYPNTRPPPSTYKKLAASSNDVAAGTSGHFDDVVSYLSIADLLRKSKLEGRNWPEPDLPGFNEETTANMTSPSTDPSNPHFMSSGVAGSGQEFTASTDNGITSVSFGYALGTYAGCIWWPEKLYLLSGNSRRAFNLYVEFAATDNTSDNFPGFTLGFLSGSDPAGAPTNSTCGTTYLSMYARGNTGTNELVLADASGLTSGFQVTGTGIPAGSTIVWISGTTVYLSSNLTSNVDGNLEFANTRLIRRDLGWAGGTLASYTDRFAVEFDAARDSFTFLTPPVPSAFDPSRPHLAADFGGVEHDGTDAASCTTYNYGAGCNRPALDTFPSPTPTPRTATGISGAYTIKMSDASGVAGILHGMSVTGTGIGPGAKVVGIASDNTVTLDVANIDAVSGTITFSTVSSSTFMQNGLGVFHSMRVEVLPQACTGLNATGNAGDYTITVHSTSGVSLGMGVYGSGIGPGATVTGIAGTTVTLSIPNGAAVANPVTFAWPPNTTKTGSGTTGLATISLTDVQGISLGMTATASGTGAEATVTGISHAANTVTLSTANTANFTTQTVTFKINQSVTATGISGQNTIEVAGNAGLFVGMSVDGLAIGDGAAITQISGTTITLSVANSGTVSNTVTFAPPRLANTLLKSWTLSNAGCNTAPSTCTAMQTLTGQFAEYLSNDNQALHVVSCLSPTTANAFDSLYFGITTANRTVSAGGTAYNVVFRKLGSTRIEVQ